MAVDNQFLLATILAVGLGYFALTRKPEPHPAAFRKELQAQNVLLQMDQVDDIFHEFKVEFSKRGVNAETTPMTPDEFAQLNGLERNIRRIDKEVGRNAPFDRGDLERFAQRRDDLYENIEKFKSKYPQSVLQNQEDSRVSAMDLGDIVEQGAHKDLFKSVAPSGTLGRSLSRTASLSRAVSPHPERLDDSFSRVNEKGWAVSAERSISRSVGKYSPHRSFSRSPQKALGFLRGISKVRQRRASRGKSAGQGPFDNAPKANKRVNKDKPSDGMVLQDQRGGFEAVLPQNNNNSQEDTRNTNQQNSELGSDRVKEGVVLVGPVNVEAPSIPTGFDSVKGLTDDNVEMAPTAEVKPVKPERPKKKLPGTSPQTQPSMDAAPDPKAPTEQQVTLKRLTDDINDLDRRWDTITSHEALNEKLGLIQARLRGIVDSQGRLGKEVIKSYKLASARIDKGRKTRDIDKVVIPSVQRKEHAAKRLRKKPPPRPAALRRSASSLVGIGSSPNMNTAPKPPNKL